MGNGTTGVAAMNLASKTRSVSKHCFHNQKGKIMHKVKRFFDPGAPWLLLSILLALVFALSGCAGLGTQAPATAPAQEALGVHDVAAARAMALQKIGESGDPETKRLAIFALVTMGHDGYAAAPVVVQAPRSVGDAIFGFLDRTFERVLAVAPAYLAYKGQVRSAQTTESVAAINRDVSLNQSNNFLALGSAGIGGTASVGIAGVNALATVASRPGPPTTSLAGNAGPILIGNGNLTVAPITGSYNPITNQPLTCTTNPTTGVRTCV